MAVEATSDRVSVQMDEGFTLTGTPEQKQKCGTCNSENCIPDLLKSLSCLFFHLKFLRERHKLLSGVEKFRNNYLSPMGYYVYIQ